MPAGEACRECTTLVAADLAKETPLGVLTIANNQVGKIDSCVDSIEKVLRCDCGENCIMLDRKKPSRKKGTTPMPQHDKAPPKHDLLADEQAPVCRLRRAAPLAAEPEVTSSSKGRPRGLRGASMARARRRGGRPQRHGKACRSPRPESGRLHRVPVLQYGRYKLEDGSCRGCSLRKAALPKEVADTAETLWLERPAQLHLVTAIAKINKDIKWPTRT